ncbi:MAG: MBL fold metallo-hydrolase [Sphingomonadaceae bacterium]
MPASVTKLTAGPLDTNSYLAWDDDAGLAVVVDAPWGITSRMLEEIRRRSVRVICLVLTHGHWDHVADATELAAAAGTVIAAHPLEVPQLEAPAETLYEVPFAIPSTHPERLLEDGDTLDAGAFHFHLLHTPGHSPGSICLYEPDRKLLFSGDTLFHNGYGRTDLPGGSDEAMEQSLARLASLPDEVRVLPGHGPETSVGQERWLRRIPVGL